MRGVKFIKTKDNLIQNPLDRYSHVVLLGAGASNAAFPNGEATGKSLPLMDNFVKTLGLSSLLKGAKIDPTGNFETIYSNIKDDNLRKILEERINGYFNKLELPATATLYDRLLLSLREKDTIFTFNWDPFLFDAYQRNKGILPLPEIYFLHGNVRIGSCKTHYEFGRRGNICSTCNAKFEDVTLLYPIEKKNYFTKNKYIASSWKEAKDRFANAFTLTIFGYSAPTSDIEAKAILQTAWLSKSKRKFEHIEIIDIIDASNIAKRWKKLTPTYHSQTSVSFEKTRLWRWPRRSCEASFYPMTGGHPCEEFPLLETERLDELQQASKHISEFE